MNDADEDVPSALVGEEDDADNGDDIQDFRFLAHFVSGNGKIPKRGEKDFEPYATQKQSDILNESLDAMQGAYSIPRWHNAKNLIVAYYDFESNMCWVEKAKGLHFKSVGKVVDGKLWLLPEEALYLLERGTIDIRWQNLDTLDSPATDRRADGVAEYEELDANSLPMSLQGAYAAFIGREDAVGGALTIERYTVYAGLKRAGYAVVRADSWDGPGCPPGSDCLPLAKGEGNLALQLLTRLYNSLKTVQSHGTPSRTAHGPLASPGLYRDYNEIYRMLQIIPSYDPTAKQSAAEVRSLETEAAFRITYHVYKPNPQFKKSAPGPPDFRIAVVDARETNMPTLSELSALIDRVPYAPPREDAQMYNKILNGYKNVILAIIDQGVPSYVRLTDAAFGREKLYHRKSPGPVAKRGRGGGARRGYGTGRKTS